MSSHLEQLRDVVYCVYVLCVEVSIWSISNSAQLPTNKRRTLRQL